MIPSLTHGVFGSILLYFQNLEALNMTWKKQTCTKKNNFRNLQFFYINRDLYIKGYVGHIRGMLLDRRRDALECFSNERAVELDLERRAEEVKRKAWGHKSIQG